MTDPATPAPSPEPMAPLSLEERARAAGLAMLSLHAGDVAALSVERDRLASEVETLRSQLAAAMANAAETMHAARMVEAEAIRERDEARRQAVALRGILEHISHEDCRWSSAIDHLLFVKVDG